MAADAPGAIAQHIAGGAQIDLRRWFTLFVVWMVGLAVLVFAGRIQAEAGSRPGFVVMVLAAYAFYLSLCCTFFPAPTMWVVMLAASNGLALVPAPVPRIVLVTVLGGLATSMANLNEYHIFTFLLQYRRIARVRETRVYRWAARWFAVSPFTIICFISLVPVPVDVIRWLAILYRYPRGPFFVAYFLGRSARYAIWSVSAVYLDLGVRGIAIFQGALIALAAAKVITSAVRRRRRTNTQNATP
jgi:membrane protein YqaA with SNARE-associated domain